MGSKEAAREARLLLTRGERNLVGDPVGLLLRRGEPIRESRRRVVAVLISFESVCL